MSDDTVFIHDLNLERGWSIGDLFNSLVYYRYTKNIDTKITVITHKSLHELVLFLFGDFVEKCDDIMTPTTRRFQKTFLDLPRVATSELTLKYNFSLLDSIPDTELLPNKSILLIFNRSDNYILPKEIIDLIISLCVAKNIFVRNVQDNAFYDSSRLELGTPTYTANIMALIKSCMRRDIKIIKMRTGLDELLAYLSPTPMFLLYPTIPGWVDNWDYSVRNCHAYLKPLSTITEYKLSSHNKDELIKKLNIFLT